MAEQPSIQNPLQTATNINQTGTANVTGNQIQSNTQPAQQVQSVPQTGPKLENDNIALLKEKIMDTSDEEVPLETSNKRIYYASIVLLILVILGVLGALYLRTQVNIGDTNTSGELNL